MRPVLFPSRRAFATVNTAAIAHNFSLLSTTARKVNPTARTVAVVKANAYGHGVQAVVPALCAVGCDFFAVATLEEALTVRALAPKADILILGYTPPVQAPLLRQNHLTQTVFSLSYGKALAERGPCRVHVKLDGGLCRLGLSVADKKDLHRLLQLQNLQPVGLFTHFPAADTDQTATKAALARFLSVAQGVARRKKLFLHAAASATLLTLPEAVLSGPRVGLALYGISPVKTNLALCPALELCAPVVQLREVPAGTPVGYGGDFVTDRPSCIGTLPIGYADGFDRRLTGLAVTLCHGQESFSVPVVGRISMDQLTVDLTDTPAAVGDRVILWRDPTAIAKQLGTIPYEVLTSISQRVLRVPVYLPPLSQF